MERSLMVAVKSGSISLGRILEANETGKRKKRRPESQRPSRRRDRAWLEPAGEERTKGSPTNPSSGCIGQCWVYVSDGKVPAIHDAMRKGFKDPRVDLS